MDSTLRYIHNDSDLSTNSSFSPEEERKSKVQVNDSDFWFSYMLQISEIFVMYMGISFIPFFIQSFLTWYSFY